MAAKKITKKKKKVIVTIVVSTLTFLATAFIPDSNPIKKGVFEFINQIGSVIITPDDTVSIPDTTFVY